MLASSTAPPPTTYVTFGNPSLLHKPACKPWTTYGRSLRFGLIIGQWLVCFDGHCCVDQRLLALLRPADMPTPWMWAKRTESVQPAIPVCTTPEKRSSTLTTTCTAFPSILMFSFSVRTYCACTAYLPAQLTTSKQLAQTV